MALTKIGTDGVKDDAITSGKIPANAVGSSELADNAVDRAAIADDAVNADKITAGGVDTNALGSDSVTTVKILNANVTTDKLADNAVTSQKIANNSVTLAKLENGTSSNDGKFLRANNGADPSFETVSIPAGTTISGNADNRVITGSDTANTLNAEAGFTHNPATDDTQIITSNNLNVADLLVQHTGGGAGAVARLTLHAGSNANSGCQLGLIVGSHSWYLETPKNAGNLNFMKGGQKFRMGDDGDFYINDGDLVIGTGGHGIDFSADGNGTLKTLPGSFNAELLHDYETGTFTPNIQYDTGTGRYAGNQVSSAVGEYIRIGDLVNVGMKITLTSNQNHTEGTHIYIGGMPYNGLHSSQQSSMMNGWGGWACPTNDNNFSYDVRYCYHGYTTINLGFSQTSGNGGINGFYVWGFYRTSP